MPGNSITQSFWQAANFGLQMQNNKRMQEAAQMQNMLHQIQIQKMASDLMSNQRGREAINTPMNAPMLPEYQVNGMEDLRSQMSTPTYQGADYEAPSIVPQASREFNPAFQGFKKLWTQPDPAVAMFDAGMDPEEIKKFIPQVAADKQAMTLENLLAEQVKSGKMTLQEALAAKKNGEGKEVNVANEIDTVLGGMFPGYYTDASVRKRALDYYATPEGSEIVQKKAQVYNQGKAAPIYNIIQTPSGYAAVNNRNPQRVIDLGIDKPLSPAETDEIASLLSVKDSIEKVRGLFNPKYIGPVASTYGKMSGKVEALTNMEAQQLYAASAELRKTLFDLGGKQLTANEIKVLAPFIPSDTDSPTTYEQKLNNFEVKYNNILQNKLKAFKASGIGVNIEGGNPEGKKVTAGTALDKKTAWSILQEAGGDKVKARRIAIMRGYKIK